jgi:hypothetical protein
LKGQFFFIKTDLQRQLMVKTKPICPKIIMKINQDISFFGILKLKILDKKKDTFTKIFWHFNPKYMKRLVQNIVICGRGKQKG